MIDTRVIDLTVGQAMFLVTLFMLGWLFSDLIQAACERLVEWLARRIRSR